MFLTITQYNGNNIFLTFSTSLTYDSLTDINKMMIWARVGKLHGQTGFWQGGGNNLVFTWKNCICREIC